MNRSTLKRSKLALAVAAASLFAVAPLSSAKEKHKQHQTIPLTKDTIYFELNDTDGDLGIHALLDGDPWRVLYMTDARNRIMLSISNSGRLARQGLTELFFESAEPSFDELGPESFFRRFPEGEYKVFGITLEGDRLKGSDMVSHVIPAPAGNITVSGIPVPDNCDDGGAVVMANSDFLIAWDPVITSHPDLGAFASEIEIVNYQVVLEREEPTPLKFTYDLAPENGTVLRIPGGLINADEEIKLEILAREVTGNQTAIETCFQTE